MKQKNIQGNTSKVNVENNTYKAKKRLKVKEHFKQEY